MAAAIVLVKKGRRKDAMYSIVAKDSRKKLKGRFVAKLGSVNRHDKTIQINKEKAVEFLLQGIQPSKSVRDLFSATGIMLRKHNQVGVRKGAITQAVADQRIIDWENQFKDKKRAFKEIINAPKKQSQATPQEVSSKEQPSPVVKKTQKSVILQKDRQAKQTKEAKVAATQQIKKSTISKKTTSNTTEGKK